MNLLNQFPQASPDAIFNDFTKTFLITYPKPKKGEEPGPEIRLSMEWEDPIFTAEIVNRLVEEVERTQHQKLFQASKPRLVPKLGRLKEEGLLYVSAQL